MSKLTVVPPDESNSTDKETQIEKKQETSEIFHAVARKNAEKKRKATVDRRTDNESLVRRWNLRASRKKKPEVDPRG